MDTKTLVQNTARIVRIVELAPGDVYKRLEEPTYSGGKAELRFGIVTDVMHNGERAAVVALEHTSDYHGATVTQKVFTDTSSDATIFAATPDEVNAHLADILEALKRKSEAARKVHVEALEKQKQFEAMLLRLHNGDLVLRSSITEAAQVTA